jgi:hypothetical protein
MIIVQNANTILIINWTTIEVLRNIFLLLCMFAFSVRRRNIASVKKKVVNATIMIPAIYMIDSRYIVDNSNCAPDKLMKEELKTVINIILNMSATMNDMKNSIDNIANSDRP